MQARKPLPSRTRRAKSDVLDQKWLTYLLTLVLILLIAIFAVSLTYQEKLVQHTKDFLQRAKKALLASLGLNTKFKGLDYQSFVNSFIFSPLAASPSLCCLVPFALFTPLVNAPEFKSFVAE